MAGFVDVFRKTWGWHSAAPAPPSTDTYQGARHRHARAGTSREQYDVTAGEVTAGIEATGHSV